PARVIDRCHTYSYLGRGRIAALALAPPTAGMQWLARVRSGRSAAVPGGSCRGGAQHHDDCTRQRTETVMKLGWLTIVPAVLLPACAEAPADRAGMVPAPAADAVQPVGDGADPAQVAAADDSASVLTAPDGFIVAATRREATGAASTGGMRDGAPAQIRGIYLNAYAAGSARRLPTLLALADTTELNTFVVDVKDEKGIHYRSELELPT